MKTAVLLLKKHHKSRTPGNGFIHNVFLIYNRYINLNYYKTSQLRDGERANVDDWRGER